MITKLENDLIEISVKEDGAEQVSFKLKEDGTEYLWQANPAVWGRYAPVLFPIVGRVKDNQYTIDGKTYMLGQHGFARDSKFVILTQTENSVEYQIISNKETMKIYPFQFKLNVKYEIKDRTLKVAYTVENIDDKKIYFSVGAHPGFKCPIVEGENIEDYYLEFSEKETAEVLRLNEESLVSSNKALFLKNENIIPLSEKLFADGVLIFEDLKSEKISMKSKKTNKSITMEFQDFKYFGIWTVPDQPQFVCLEPWHGIADFDTSDGNLKTKEGIKILEQGEKFQCFYSITIR